MSQRAHLTVVRSDSLPPPLLPPDVDLGDMPAVMVERKWLRDSRLRIVATADEMLAAITLQGASLEEKPSGSLPSDDAELAFLALYGRDKDGWLAVKARALDGWVLCSDGRYYNEAIARRVLDSWIKRVVARRKADAGNSAKKKVAFDPAAYDQALARAATALAQLDPYAPVLRSYKPAAPELVHAPPATPPASPSATPNISEATRRESETDMPGRRPGPDLSTRKLEIEDDQGLPPTPDEVRATYPPDAFAQFYDGRYPLKVGRKRAEAAFLAVKAKGDVPFPVLMTGLERYLRAKPPNQDFCHPVTWLHQERWADGAAPRASSGGAGPPRMPRTVWIDEDTPQWRAHLAAARREGRLGLPRQGHPDDSRRRGWLFDSEWPPGVDPVGYGGDARPGDR